MKEMLRNLPDAEKAHLTSWWKKAIDDENPESDGTVKLLKSKPDPTFFLIELLKNYAHLDRINDELARRNAGFGDGPILNPGYCTLAPGITELVRIGTVANPDFPEVYCKSAHPEGPRTIDTVAIDAAIANAGGHILRPSTLLQCGTDILMPAVPAAYDKHRVTNVFPAPTILIYDPKFQKYVEAISAGRDGIKPKLFGDWYSPENLLIPRFSHLTGLSHIPTTFFEHPLSAPAESIPSLIQVSGRPHNPTPDDKQTDLNPTRGMGFLLCDLSTIGKKGVILTHNMTYLGDRLNISDQPVNGKYEVTPERVQIMTNAIVFATVMVTSR